MSWKSFLTAGLLCVLAAPVFAAPTLTLTKGGTFANGNLDVNGNWVWKVQISPDVALVPDSSGTPVAAELGFTSTNRSLIGAANLSTGALDDFDTKNPGAVIFSSWQTSTNGLLDAASNNRPTGLQLNGPGIGTTAGSSYTANSSVSGSANQVFAALGSVNYTTAGPKDFISITVAGPDTDSTQLTTTVQVGGVYGTGSINGRLTQITGLTGSTYTTSNFDTFGAAVSRTVKAGDADMDGNVDGLDLAIIAANFGATSGKKWYHADYNADGAVDGLDLAIIAANFGFSGPPPGAGAGGGLSSGAVPEPASVALLGLAMLGALGVVRRKR